MEAALPFKIKQHHHEAAVAQNTTEEEFCLWNRSEEHFGSFHVFKSWFGKILRRKSKNVWSNLIWSEVRKYNSYFYILVIWAPHDVPGRCLSALRLRSQQTRRWHWPQQPAASSQVKPNAPPQPAATGMWGQVKRCVRWSGVAWTQPSERRK